MHRYLEDIPDWPGDEGRSRKFARMVDVGNSPHRDELEVRIYARDNWYPITVFGWQGSDMNKLCEVQVRENPGKETTALGISILMNPWHFEFRATQAERWRRIRSIDRYEDRVVIYHDGGSYTLGNTDRIWHRKAE
jgi:hypothetical protein